MRVCEICNAKKEDRIIAGMSICNNCFTRLQTSLDKGTQRKTTENELPSLTQCTA